MQFDGLSILSLGRLVAAYFLFAFLWATPLTAAEQKKEPLTTFSADRVRYDRELSVITATGNVEVIRASRTLRADTLSYNQKTDVVTASGNIALAEPSGEVMFAQYMELTGDFKDGIVEDIGILLSDGARFAAAGARRSNANIFELRNAVYSPCNLCEEDPTRPPLWQIKASKVVHDKNRQQIEYSDAWLEVFGVPVFYTPYLAHPDPTVKRRSGFMFPSIGSSSDLGTVVQVPYYYVTSPQSDATITPIYTSDEGPVLLTEFRNRSLNGEFDFRGSITDDSKDRLLWHIGSKGRYDINDTWRAGFDINRSKNETYLRRYGFTADDTLNTFGSRQSLTSNIYAEGFRRRNYASVNGYLFQDLREEVGSGDSPIIFPLAEYKHVGEADRFGGRTEFDASLMALTRTSGVDSRRISLKAGWTAPQKIGPLGDVYSFSTSVKGDVYYVDEVARGNKALRYSGFAKRIIPEARLDWRFPFINKNAKSNTHQVFEPIVSAIVSPYGSNPNTIPNEDSKDFVFNTTNLFSNNRFTGLDRVESGPRVNYGVRWGVFGKSSGQTTVTIGQSYRLKRDDTFSENSGLEDNFSDVVAQVLASPQKYIGLLYRTRLSKDNLEPRETEVNATIGNRSFSFASTYTFLDQSANTQFFDREEVTFSASSQITKNWRASFSSRRDLKAKQVRSLAGSVAYENECCVLSVNASRTFFEDRDLKPTDSVFIRLILKTIGEVQNVNL